MTIGILRIYPSRCWSAIHKCRTRWSTFQISCFHRFGDRSTTRPDRSTNIPEESHILSGRRENQKSHLRYTLSGYESHCYYLRSVHIPYPELNLTVYVLLLFRTGWQAFASTEMNIWAELKARHFMTRWTTISFSRSIQIVGVTAVDMVFIAVILGAVRSSSRH
jgi:hypothetical protein